MYVCLFVCMYVCMYACKVDTREWESSSSASVFCTDEASHREEEEEETRGKRENRRQGRMSSGPDALFPIRNLFYLGAYQAAINDTTSSSFHGLSESDTIERDCLLYRSYISLASYQVLFLLLLLTHFYFCCVLPLPFFSAFFIYYFLSLFILSFTCVFVFCLIWSEIVDRRSISRSNISSSHEMESALDLHKMGDTRSH